MNPRSEPRPRASVRLLPAAGLLLLTAGCSDAPRPVASEPPPAASTRANSTGAGSTDAADPGELPEGHPPVGGPLRFVAQEGWVTETPSSSMRRAQYRLPAVEGDPEDAELVVYYFGEQAGTVEANVERWCSQFAQPDGSDSRGVLVRRSRYVAGRGVEEIELHGTYVAETSPGSGERLDKPGFAMLAAIVSSDHGPYYLKLVGPDRTIEHWRDSFTAFVSAIES